MTKIVNLDDLNIIKAYVDTKTTNITVDSELSDTSTNPVQNKVVNTALGNKQDKLSTQTTYTAKGSATKVPKISTNNLGQVTAIEEVTITQPTVNNGTLTIQKNGTQVGTFTANQSGNTTVNITVPTKASDIDAATSSHTHSYLEKTTYEKSAELACGSNGLVCLGKFGAYDTNITIELNSTTSTTYHATIVIHSQNVVANGTGGTVGCYVYDDADNHITPLLSIFRPYGSASRQIEVYASLPGWSKNLVHVQAVALSDGGMTDVLTSVTSIPTSISGKQKITPVNVLTANYATKDHTHNYAGSASAGGSATSAVKLDSSAGSSTKPVYFSDGKPVECTYTLNKSVPADAVFTDTTYSTVAADGKNPGLMSIFDKVKLDGIEAGATKVEASATNGKIKINGTDTLVYTHPTGTNPHGTTKSDVGLGNVGNFKAVSTVASQGLTSTEQSNARANIGAGTSSLTIGTTSTTAAAGNHTHTTSMATSTSTNELTLAHGGKYALTAGGDAFVFTMPAQYSHPSSHAASMITGLATVATSGSYNDLTNKPTIPSAYILPAAGDALGGVKSGNDVTILNGLIAVNDDSHNHSTATITGLASVATSGSYNDLSNKPTIPNAVTESTVSGWGFTKNTGDITGVTAGKGLTDGGTSGAVTLNVGAGTGITVNDNDIAVQYGTTAGTACQGNDSRLSDARTPTSHTHGNITNTGTITSTAVTAATGVLVYDSNNKIQRATAAQTRAIIGAGTSSLTIGTTATTAAAGNHTHSEYAASSHGTHVSYSDTLPSVNSGLGSAGSAATVARSDHVHPAPIIKTASGSNINTVGTPSVSVSTTTAGVTTLTFDYLKGAKGDPGTNGTSVTVSSTSVTYQASSSGTTTPTGTWSSSVPSVSNGQYLWTKTVVNYSDGKSTTSYSVGYKGTNGTNGTNGVTPTIQAAAGTNINTVGTPSVTASTSGTTTTFTFNNLKGEKGDPGTNGAAAGFGTVSATVQKLLADAEPTVSVDTGGDNTAKNFTFNFGIPVGTGSTDSGKIYYGTCSTTGSTAAKTVSITGFDSTKLVAGVMVAVKMTYTSTATSNNTLNVSSTGAKTILGAQTNRYVRYVSSTSTYPTYQKPWLAGSVCWFMYDGTYWQWMNASRTRMWVSGSTLYIYDN